MNLSDNYSEPNRPAPGFGQHDVPEMPPYVQSYSKRGNSYDAQVTPVYNQARFGNKTGKGGMDAYLSEVEDKTYFDGYKQKKGNMGVYEQLRWGPGYDWRGGFGIASLNASKNYTMSTRGGQLRKGGPKRSDYIDRPNYWFEVTRPGISTSRYTQSNRNYSGLYENRKRTPIIQTNADSFILRQMIEHNPYAISSHSAEQAKAIYDREGFNVKDHEFPAYHDNIALYQNQARFPKKIYDNGDYVHQGQIFNDPNLVLDNDMSFTYNVSKAD